MARAKHLLNLKVIKALSEPGRHADGDGLYLVVDKSASKRWVFLYSLGGKRREKGLGGWPTVAIDRARDLADNARRLVANGIDPIDVKKATLKAVAVPAFRDVAEDYIKLKGPSFRNEKHLAQWRTSVGLDPINTDKIRIDREAHGDYVAGLTKLSAKRVDEIQIADVLAVVSPIWQAAPETASRVRGRIEAVLDAARVADHRTGDNPARWVGNLALMLPARTRASRGHHAAAAYDEVPGIVSKLRATGGISASALEFTILTAARTGEVLGATWSEVNFDEGLWTIPGSRMKAGRVHRVPLPDRAVAILKAMKSVRQSDAPDAFAFPGARRGKPLSAMALAMALRRAEVGEATVHGMRSAFRDWAGDMTDFPREVAEAALAHAVGDEVEAAYRRSDALEKRRKLMDAWAKFVG